MSSHLSMTSTKRRWRQLKRVKVLVNWILPLQLKNPVSTRSICTMATRICSTYRTVASVSQKKRQKQHILEGASKKFQSKEWIIAERNYCLAIVATVKFQPKRSIQTKGILTERTDVISMRWWRRTFWRKSHTIWTNASKWIKASSA